MAKHQPRGTHQLFIETKLGIVTRTGEWFHTTSEEIEKFVPGLLDSVRLEKLVREARAWVRSADSLSLTLLMALLFLVNPWLAAVTAAAFHWLWYTYKSALVNTWSGMILSALNSDGYQYIIALVALSLLGMEGYYTALVIGALYFFVFRFSLLDKAWDRLTASEELTLNDRLMKMLLIKYAISEGLSPKKVQEMEDRIVEKATSRKGGG